LPTTQRFPAQMTRKKPRKIHLAGSYIPFAKTKEELEERYKDNADYVRKLALAARTLIEERFLLPEDAERIISAARKTGAVAMKGQ
jgi:Mg-chelatase subunit ChlI